MTPTMLQQMNGDQSRAAYRAFCPTRMAPTSGLRPSAESDLLVQRTKSNFSIMIREFHQQLEMAVLISRSQRLWFIILRLLGVP